MKKLTILFTILLSQSFLLSQELYFNGSNEYAYIEHNSDLVLTNNLEIHLSIKSNSYSGSNVAGIITKATDNHDIYFAEGWYLGVLPNGTLMFNMFESDGNSIGTYYMYSNNSGYLDNQWHDVQLYVDLDGGTCSMWVDGSLHDSIDGGFVDWSGGSFDLNTTTPLILGSGRGLEDNSYYFGEINNVSIINNGVEVVNSDSEWNFENSPIYGCTTGSACNYLGSANVDDGSCTYAEENFDCDGNCADQDCAGICDGLSVVDDCGVCGGDSSLYGTFDVTHVVALVDAILENGWVSCSDFNVDGSLDIVDIVQIVEFILGSARLTDATNVRLINDENSLTLETDGFIGGIQMTLSHNEDFSLELTAKSMVSNYKTNGAETVVIIVTPEAGELFTATSAFVIEDIIAATSAGELEVDINLPVEFGLSSAYPNPFNPSTSFDVYMSSSDLASVAVYNIMGQLIQTIHSGELTSGKHTFNWNASSVSSGVYFIKATTQSDVAVQKVMLMK